MSDNKKPSKGSEAPNQTMLRRALFMLIACGIVAFTVLGGRLFALQVVDHEMYEELAVEQQMRETRVNASRGTIYDTNMKILAMSATVETIFISPVEIVMYDEDASLIASGLSRILGVSYESVLEKAGNTKSWYQTIAKKVEQNVADQVREFKNEYKLKGVKIETDTKRYYPYSSLASHVIGFVGADNDGLGGIEAKYDAELQGIAGRIVRAKNSAGTDMLFTKFEDYYDATDGNDLVLTLDSTIQYYVEKQLEQAIADYQIKNGAAAIAMDVNTGKILAMASLGNFDLNNYQEISDEAKAYIEEHTTNEDAENTLLREAQNLQWRNKALSDTYEPGSVFKIITLAMALEEGLTGKGDHFYCGGNISVQGRTDPVNCWNLTGHGTQTLQQSVQHSCNCAFVDIGLRVGAERFYDYAKAFGFFGVTGLDLGGESGSIWWDEDVFFEKGSLSQLAAASFGQTFNITPLQLISAVSACANGGYLMRPYLVDSVIDADGNTVSKNEPKMVRQVISEETSDIICEMLESVVGDSVEGTGRNAYVAGYRIAGKTGTSTKTTKEVATGEKEYIVSFLGFAPADNPKIVILVMLDTPTTKTVYVSGGQMGAPTVGKMMADILPYLGVEPQYSDNETKNMDRSVPKLIGMTTDEAISALSEVGLSARVIGGGQLVTAQLPNANAVIANGSQVIIYLGAEPSGETEIMPNVVGYSYSVARQHLEYYGIYMRSAGGVVAASDKLVVSMQSIPAGAEIEHGTVIEVTLVDNSNLGRY